MLEPLQLGVKPCAEAAAAGDAESLPSTCKTRRSALKFDTPKAIFILALSTQGLIDPCCVGLTHGILI
jgi:hypothetical protein